MRGSLQLGDNQLVQHRPIVLLFASGILRPAPASYQSELTGYGGST